MQTTAVAGDDRSGTAGRMRWVRAGMVVPAAVGLCWPALWNGYPLLCPDAVGYLLGGPVVWAGLLHGSVGAVGYQRSELYSLVLYVAGAGRSVWPPVLLQALLTAWVVWLTVRGAGLRRPERAYAVLMVVLCAGTGAAWFASWVMPDVLGPVLYLGLAVWVFAGETLRRWERGVLLAVCGWAMAAHATHLLVVAAVLLVLALAWACRWKALRGRGGALVMMAGVCVASVVTQVGVHLRVDGSAAGPAGPPYLLARAVSDGPAREYLRTHCAALTWTICRYQAQLSADPAEFLWAPHGVWFSATDAEQAAMRRETTPLVVATMRDYPKQQVQRSWANVVGQLEDFALVDFESNEMVARRVGEALSGAGAVYAGTRQARDAMPQAACSAVQRVVVGLSALLVLVLLPWVRPGRFYAGLAVVVVVSLVANAMVTGVLSGVYARYQARVVWMVVVLAALLVTRAVERRERA